MSGRAKAGTGLGLAVLLFALVLPFSLWRHLGGQRARYDVSAAPRPDSRRAQLDADVIPFLPRRTHPPVTPNAAPITNVTPAAPAPAPREPELPLTGEDLERLVRDLRDDDVPGNARRAVERLHRLASSDSDDRHVVRDRLDLALWSDDPQQLFFAAQILYRNEVLPNPHLFEVALLALRNDRERDRVRPFTENAACAVSWLRDRVGRVRGELLARLGSDDSQERFLAAYLLARSGVRDQLARQVAILEPRLADNDVDADATLAVIALAAHGPIVMRYLPHPTEVEDQQIRECLLGLPGRGPGPTRGGAATGDSGSA